MNIPLKDFKKFSKTLNRAEKLLNNAVVNVSYHYDSHYKQIFTFNLDNLEFLHVKQIQF